MDIAMIDLRVSNEAREAISLTLADDNGLMPAIFWKLNEKNQGSWILGFSFRERIPEEDIFVLSGMNIAVSGPPQYFPLLKGKVLHYADDEYVLIDNP
jgi:hypothetical protein